MSYGLMLSVQLGNATQFDRIFRWVLTYMYHSSGPLQGWSAWHCGIDGH